MKYYKLDPAKTHIIYRFIPVYRLFDILAQNTITLMRTSKWDDPFESFLFDCCTDNFYHFMKHKEIKSSLFFLCFSTAIERDFIWKIYTPDRNGVRIRLKVNKISSFFGDQFILGQVKYPTIDKIKTLLRTYKIDYINRTNKEELLMNLFFYKRRAFMDEKEVRLIYIKPNIADDYISVDFNARDLIDQILFDPRIDDSVFNKYSEHLKTVFGFNKSILKSSLYQPAKDFMP